ncbi:COG3904 family protein [Pseudoxanthomonas daejeonensis]|uniref:COG3904 family protein n=1 Tax=Pseudoxanthomonas daejeonensis TaxID=266062 RepID=UPI001EE3CB37|nr:hypothetical protein [Pseudoxanthomonas daejeonensis]
MPILRVCLFLACASLLAGCSREPASAPADDVQTQTVASPEEGGAVSRAPMATPAQPTPVAAPVPSPPVAKVPDWSPLELASGQAWIDCRLDYREGDGEPFSTPTRDNLRHLLEPCRDGDVLRLRYRGKIASDFTALVERVTRVADSLGIESRVLDLDSTGGQVEDAIRAGDWIGGNRWTIWVREDSVCHSACVFVLAGGDSRRLAGRVGIHRIIRLSSTATSRTELNTELQAVYATVRGYLERNGASPLLADVMKTVPNRSLRLLTGDELRMYGLDGNNAAQDDLDRVRLLDKCGDDFMRRRDAWVRAFDGRCREQPEVYALNACGLQLRRDFGFPDDDCPAESPLAEFNELPEALPAEMEPPATTTIGEPATAIDAQATAGEPPAGEGQGSDTAAPAG